MDFTLKRLTENGEFSNKVLPSTQHKTNSNISRPIVQDVDTKTNFTSDSETHSKKIKQEDFSDVKIKIESELDNATMDKDIHYEQTWISTGMDDSINSEDSAVIKEELNVEEEAQGSSSHDIHSSRQITDDCEDVKPLFPLNLTQETLPDPKTIEEISRDPDTLKPSRLSIFIKEETDTILEPSTEKIPEEIKKTSSSTLKIKSCQVDDKRLPKKRLSVTLIDILKYPNSTFPSINKLPSDSKTLNGKPMPTRKDTEDRPITCAICEKTYKSKAHIRFHLRTHSEERRQTCEVCKRILANKTSLKHHMKTHTFEGEFKCKEKECSKLFFRERDLQKHMKSHLHVKRHNCPHCDKSYTIRSVLTCHVRKNHTQMDLHKCNVCNKVFLSKTEFEEHYRIHTGERPIVCKLCSKKFRGKIYLRRHIKFWHEAKVTCNECQETLPNKFELRKHMRIHFPLERHICPDCGLVAAYSSNLVSHRRVHTGERPFKCEVCQMAFALYDTLRRHMVKHTGKYPYQCNKCGKGFVRRNLFKSHCITHDNKTIFNCTICGLSLRYEVSYRMHYATHKSNARNCEVCHLKFRMESTFKEHCKKHLKIKGEFNCMVCKKEFESQKDLIAHCQKTLDLWGKCPDN